MAGENLEANFNESIRIELNGTDLPDEVYEEYDLAGLDEILEEIDEDEAHFTLGESHYEEEVVVYVIECVSAKAAWRMLEQAIRDYPLCRSANVTLIGRDNNVIAKLKL